MSASISQSFDRSSLPLSASTYSHSRRTSVSQGSHGGTTSGSGATGRRRITSKVNTNFGSRRKNKASGFSKNGQRLASQMLKNATTLVLGMTHKDRYFATQNTLESLSKFIENQIDKTILPTSALTPLNTVTDHSSTISNLAAALNASESHRHRLTQELEVSRSTLAVESDEIKKLKKKNETLIANEELMKERWYGLMGMPDTKKEDGSMDVPVSFSYIDNTTWSNVGRTYLSNAQSLVQSKTVPRYSTPSSIRRRGISRSTVNDAMDPELFDIAASLIPRLKKVEDDRRAGGADAAMEVTGTIASLLTDLTAFVDYSNRAL